MANYVDRTTLFGPKDNVTYFSCIVGERVLLHRPAGYKGIKFKYTEGPNINPKTSVHIDYYRYGFRILFPELGKFISDSNDVNRSYVIYLHEKSGEQIIEFVSDELGSFKFYVVIQGITLHDHASIAMGGPAYATYFTKQNQEPEE